MIRVDLNHILSANCIGHVHPIREVPVVKEHLTKCDGSNVVGSVYLEWKNGCSNN